MSRISGITGPGNTLAAVKPTRLALALVALLTACSTGSTQPSATTSTTSATSTTAVPTTVPATTSSSTQPIATTSTTTAPTTTAPTTTSSSTPTTAVGSTTTSPPPPTVTTTVPLADVSLGLESVASDFTAPVFVLSRASAGGAAGDNRMFVVDQTGTITAFVPPPPGATVRVRSVVLDISDRVGYGGERGLLGAAFHPDSPDRLFVDYTRTDGATVVEEYSFPVGADAAEAEPVRTILVQPQPTGYHNGGMIAFGPDRHLYVALGDGGDSTNGQDPYTLLGTILRLDVDSGVPYAIPGDNPFADGVDGAPEVWLWGLRNPWRFSFDGTDLWIGDVGEGDWEEIDLVRPGQRGSNLGWPIFEGTHCYDGPCEDASSLLPPVFEYAHEAGRCSITGGYVYRGNALPELKGVYLFGDFCSGEIMAVRVSGGEVVDSWVYGSGVRWLTSFGVDRTGALYVTAGDSVYRVVVEN